MLKKSLKEKYLKEVCKEEYQKIYFNGKKFMFQTRRGQQPLIWCALISGDKYLKVFNGAVETNMPPEEWQTLSVTINIARQVLLTSSEEVRVIRDDNEIAEDEVIFLAFSLERYAGIYFVNGPETVLELLVNENSQEQILLLAEFVYKKLVEKIQLKLEKEEMLCECEENREKIGQNEKQI